MFTEKRAAAPFPGALEKSPDGQTSPRKTLSREPHKIRRATLQRLCPQGKQRRPRTQQRPLAQRGKGSVAKSRRFLPTCNGMTHREQQAGPTHSSSEAPVVLAPFGLCHRRLCHRRITPRPCGARRAAPALKMPVPLGYPLFPWPAVSISCQPSKAHLPARPAARR